MALGDYVVLTPFEVPQVDLGAAPARARPSPPAIIAASRCARPHRAGGQTPHAASEGGGECSARNSTATHKHRSLKTGGSAMQSGAEFAAAAPAGGRQGF